jgi:hypothetical protein
MFDERYQLADIQSPVFDLHEYQVTISFPVYPYFFVFKK